MNKKELTSALKKLGIKRGAIVMLHSSFVGMEPMDGGPDAVVDAFLDAVGPTGTLMVPAFGALGIIAEKVKARPNAVFSDCPRGTIAAIGPKAAEIGRDHWKAATAHGEGTPFTRLRDLDGYICLLGVDQDRNTTLHSIEALLELPYLNDTTATFKTPDGKEHTKTWKYYPGPHRDFIGLEHYMRHEGIIKIERINNAMVRLMKVRDLYDLMLEIGEHDPAFALCDNPACADCVKQRAAIYAAMMAQETFKLTASARLAGRYVPEMIENLKAAGISNVELDYIQGKACAKMSADKLKKAVGDFAEEGITVSGLRLFYLPETPADIVKLAKDAGIKRIIFPLGENAAEAVVAAKAAKVEVAFANNGQGGSLAAKTFKEAVGGYKAARFALNPPGFVRATEFPFLTSYKKGRMVRICGQLDLADATWDGCATRLAQGNGEVKELLSILRCETFSGWVCLGGGAAYPGSLSDAANDLARLLENM